MDTAATSMTAVTAVEPCELLRRESEELCFLRQLHVAHDKAVAALKQAMELYGKNSLRLVPFYLTLVEVALKERQLKQAEELLSLINWLLVKDRNPSASATSPNGPTASGMRSPSHASNHSHDDDTLPEEMRNLFVIRMNKLYSVLLMESEAFSEALQRAAHGAYHCALLFGPEHLYTSELYFSLGATFARMQSKSQAQLSQSFLATQCETHESAALGLFDKVVDIWYRFLTNPPEATAAWLLSHQRLRVLEASAMLDIIATKRAAALGPPHVAVGEALYTQGLVQLFLGDHVRAKTYVERALDNYSNSLGVEHASTLDVRNVLQQLLDAGV